VAARVRTGERHGQQVRPTSELARLQSLPWTRVISPHRRFARFLLPRCERQRGFVARNYFFVDLSLSSLIFSVF
jgi:hypothetical protein